MYLETYPVVSNHERTTYEFLSAGPKGTIKKVVQFVQIREDLFNLAFGDWNEITHK